MGLNTSLRDISNEKRIEREERKAERLERQQDRKERKEEKINKELIASLKLELENYVFSKFEENNNLTYFFNTKTKNQLFDNFLKTHEEADTCYFQEILKNYYNLIYYKFLKQRQLVNQQEKKCQEQQKKNEIQEQQHNNNTIEKNWAFDLLKYILIGALIVLFFPIFLILGACNSKNK